LHNLAVRAHFIGAKLGPTRARFSYELAVDVRSVAFVRTAKSAGRFVPRGRLAPAHNVRVYIHIYTLIYDTANFQCIFSAAATIYHVKGGGYCKKLIFLQLIYVCGPMWCSN